MGTPALVSAQWLANMVKRSLVGPHLRILDTSWYLPMMNRDNKKEFAETHIPGASFFDIDECSDRTSKFDHMLPSEQFFADYVGRLGIGNDSQVVVYDASDYGAFSCTRVWWMFRLFGHNQVSVLNGGFRNWVREGHPVTEAITEPEPAHFTATINRPWVKSFEDVTENITTQRFQVVDVRPYGRFCGKDPEPREGVRPGHIPGSKCMPFFKFMDQDGMMLSTDELKKFFERSQVDLSKHLCGSCGSGVTACHMVLAAHLCGVPGASVYDGSWYEWFTKAPPEHVVSEVKNTKKGEQLPLTPAAAPPQRLDMAAQTRALVSGQWLADAVRNNIVGPKLRILDTSWYLPKTKRDPKAEFEQKHIPGALFFDIDECSDRSSGLDHMLPTSGHFSQYVGELGVGNDTHVVVYDTSDFGSYSAPRVWWMFRLFGHNLVSVLDGGMKNWLTDGHPVSSEFCKPEPREFKATLNHSWVKTYEDILENIKTKQIQVVDARSAGRFRGTEPEPRDDTLPGHFPGAINMPFPSFMDASGKELETEDLSKLFREAGVDLEQPLWTTCGSGVTACHVVLAAHLLGYPGVCVYDGSWSEWFKRACPEHIISEGDGKKV